MTKTMNYNLNKPEAGDPLRLADFNQNADIIDGALNSLNTAMGQMAAPQIATGTYIGTGVCGKSNPNTLTFPFAPKIVGIVVNEEGQRCGGVLFVVGQKKSSGIGITSNNTSAFYLALTWSENTISWYTTNGEAIDQLNSSSYTYFYFAIG